MVFEDGASGEMDAALQQRGEGRWLSYLPQSEVLALLQSASAFVFASLYEGFGLPVIEAMACGTPVICWNTSALPEVTGDAAILVGSEMELSAALTTALSDANKQAELREQGLRRAAQLAEANDIL